MINGIEEILREYGEELFTPATDDKYSRIDRLSKKYAEKYKFEIDELRKIIETQNKHCVFYTSRCRTCPYFEDFSTESCGVKIMLR